MVRKQNGKWRMCVDFTDINKACPKDSYPLPSIDSLVDNASGYAILSFMDAYSRYNQIIMHPYDKSKTAFITEHGTTYQRLMDKMFAKQIGRKIEVYVDDMVAKTKVGNQHVNDLTKIFGQIRRYNMRLNPEKCAFAVQEQDWRWSYLQNLRTGNIPSDINNKKKFRRQASFFTIFNKSLYRRGFSRPLLRCLSRNEGNLAIYKAHEDICGTHVGARSLAYKFFVQNLFWPTLHQDCANKVRTCDNCQKHSPIIHIPPEELHYSDVSWPFDKWGLDILSPIPLAPCQNLKIKQHFSSVEHPQTNGLAEAANKVILHALRKKLDDAKGLWAELIPEIIWGYNTTVQSTTKETPFWLVYGSDTMIPLEISQSSVRTSVDNHEEARQTELDTIKEIGTDATLHQQAMQQLIARRHNKRMVPQSFQVKDLALHKTEHARRPPIHGKLAEYWKGPFRVIEVLGNSAYRLESLNGTPIPNTWNISYLKQFHS
ncbi:uncharacterized protein [Arachis hypogaea]|uniref:uncharacterized protein n=1 Tax=Arachis hypogaea TaxID=3818 RepID=UPI003B22174E